MDIIIFIVLLIVAIVKFVGRNGNIENDVDDYIHYNGHRYYRKK